MYIIYGLNMLNYLNKISEHFIVGLILEDPLPPINPKRMVLRCSIRYILFSFNHYKFITVIVNFQTTGTS